MAQPLQTDLLGLSLQELSGIVEGLGQPTYRARQLFEALYRQRLGSLGEITTLPTPLRTEMEQKGFRAGLPSIKQRFESVDGTIRYLLSFSDGQSVETVWMPEGDDGEAGDGSDAGDEIPASVLPVAPPTPLVSIGGPASSGGPASIGGPASPPATGSRHPRSSGDRDRSPGAAGTGGGGTTCGSTTGGSTGLQPGESPDKTEPGFSPGSSIRQFGSSAIRQSNLASDKSLAKRWGRATICISSQVGCAVDCQFCMTALLGVQRNLTAGEIVGQILLVLNDRGVVIDRDRINLVFMGQGEPFLNYDNFMKAVRLLVEGVGIPASRMTVSTAGIVPRIPDFGEEPVRPKLAISLNAPNDAIRARIMPLNRKWNLEKLLAAAREFPLRQRERLTFEYVLLGGVNDAPEHARELAERVRALRAKVNLIALNPGPDIPFATPQDDRVLAFQKILTDAGVPAFIRRPRGRDIYAACGQLKRMAG